VLDLRELTAAARRARRAPPGRCVLRGAVRGSAAAGARRAQRALEKTVEKILTSADG
jgi:hypothetical protein